MSALNNITSKSDSTTTTDCEAPSVIIGLLDESPTPSAVLQNPEETARKAVTSATLSASVAINVIRSAQLPPDISYLIASYTREYTLVTSSEENCEWEMHQLLLAENHLQEARGLVVPQRRICNFASFHSPYTVERAEAAIFVTDEEILEIHPMQFLRNSPFVKPMNTQNESAYKTIEAENPIWDKMHYDLINKELHAIARTENGKHVILQQAAKSCVPTCVAMIVLDHGKTPDYEAISKTNLPKKEQASVWVKKAGLTPVLTELEDPQNTTKVLIQCLQENGPGILQISQSKLSGHTIVLDAISETANTAIIRDPFHGWSLTIRLDALLSWIGNREYFLQVQSAP